MFDTHITPVHNSFRDGLFPDQTGRKADISAALCGRAQNLGSCLGIPFIPQIAIDKLEVVIALRFPVIRDTEGIYDHMKALARKASGCRTYDPTRSLLHGETTPRGFHEDLEPPRNPEFRRIRKAKTSMHIQCRKQDRSFPPLIRPMLPGQFAGFWPTNSKTRLPQMLHTCRHIQLDWVKEIPVDNYFSPRTYLEAIFVLDLNVNRALANHPFLTQPSLSDEQISTAFFPNPKVKQSTVDNFCDPKLSQEDIIQALENTIHVQMSMLYADLVRALDEVPDFPLSKVPASTWQQAFGWAKLTYAEIDRHLEVDDAPRIARAMELPFTVAVRKYRKRNHAQEQEGNLREPAHDKDAVSFESVLRQGSKGRQVANAAAKVYSKSNRFIRIELKLNRSEGLTNDMPKGLSKSIMVSLPEDLADLVLRVAFYSQKTFDKLIKNMPDIKTPRMEELVAFFQRLRAEVSKEKDIAIVERIISRLEFHVCLNLVLIDDHEMAKMLRRLKRRGFFISKGTSSAPRYLPNINKIHSC